MKKLILLFAFIILPVSMVWAESVSLTTYYPAPFGAYDRLRLVPRTNAPNCTAALEGLLYYDQTDQLLKICKDPGGFSFIAGVWTQNNIDNSNAEVFLTERFRTPPPANRAVNVGIGTTSPQADLHVTGGGEFILESGSVGLQMVSTTAGNDDFRFGLSNATYLHLQADNNSDGTYETDVMSFGSNGRVGIGTLSPGENLTVDGGGSDVTQRISIENGSTGTAWLRLTETNFRGGFLRYDNASGDFHIGVHDPNNTNTGQDDEAISIERGSGDVLIGGGNFPGSAQPLNVRGGIMLRDNGSNWGRLMVEYDSGNYYAVYAD